MTFKAHPSLAGIPPELRRPIYRHLFEGLTYTSTISDEIAMKNNKDLKIRSSILHTCQKLRDEAFPVFNSSVMIVDKGWQSTESIPEILAGVKRMVTDHDTSRLEDVLHQRPQIEEILVIFKDYVDNSLFLEMNELVGLLCGGHDEDLIRENILSSQTVNKQGEEVLLRDQIANIRSALEDIKKGPIKLELSYTAHCTIVLDGAKYGGCNIFGPMWTPQVDGNDIYRVTVDSNTMQLVKREINISGSGKQSKWVPAENVVFMEKAFEWPVLHVTSTGESRILSWRFTVDDMQLYDPEDFDSQEDVKEQLEDEALLKEALKSVVRCVPEPGKKKKKIKLKWSSWSAI